MSWLRGQQPGGHGFKHSAQSPVILTEVLCYLLQASPGIFNQATNASFNIFSDSIFVNNLLVVYEETVKGVLQITAQNAQED